MENNREYVEIGCVKWATMNVGASTIFDTGFYFQWGDTTPYNKKDEELKLKKSSYKWLSKVQKTVYHTGDYSWVASEDLSYTKYGYDDDRVILDLDDDAVNVIWGGNWRMPTVEDFKILIENTNILWISNYGDSGTDGMLCVDKTDRGKTLFFPAKDLSVQSNYFGSIWSSTNFRYNCSWAYRLSFFESDNIANLSSYSRWNLANCRGILSEK